MKKLPLFLTVGFVLLAIGGYFLYTNFLVKKPVEPWNLVPESSVLVYESGTCEECVESVKKSSIWDIIQKVSFYSRQSDSLKSIYDFLAGTHYSLVSLHVTKNDDFDFIFYVRTNPKNFSLVLDQWKKNKELKFSMREFNSVKIQEVSFGRHTFSWLFLEDVWVGSFTPFLIEDVIRTYETDNEINFKNRISDVYQLPRMKKDAGNLYIQFKNFSDWLGVFTTNKPISFIQEFGKSSILDIKANGKNLILNGFSSDSVKQPAYTLSIFSNQNPVPFNIKKLISNRTVMLASYGISDGSSFKGNLMLFEGRRPVLNDTLSQIVKSLSLDIDQLFENIKGEIGVCFVESKGQEISKVMLIETRQSKQWIDELNNLSSKLSIDTVFYEKYSDYEIRELPLFRFAEKMFWPLVSGFDKSYYTYLGNTIILADDLEELKKFLEDIDKEETWGKSVSQNKYLESTLLEANISLYINTPHIWNILSGSANPKWKEFILDNETLLQSLGMGAIQFSHLSESFYTNASWSYDQVDRKTQPTQVNQRIVTNIDNAIGKMDIVKNHIDKLDEILIQDSAFNLHLISSDGKILWKLELDDMIVGDVSQVDYYNNGKLQYVFATKNKLHILDRLGKYVKPFPLSIPTSDIEYVTVVDYDHSRKYRFMVASKSGALWMYDKEGNNLDGWTPKNLGGELAVAPRHHRIRGKDYIFSVLKDGKVYVLNRRGETLKNFPLDIEAKPAGDYFLELGSDIAHTYFVIVSRDGYRIKFNLEGKIQSRETLLKNSPTAQFALVKERSDKSYLLLRQENKHLALIDNSSRELITNDFIGMNPVDIQYVDFGVGKIFIVITDRRQDLSFIYDAQGNLLTIPPLESYFTTLRYSDRNKTVIFKAYQKAISIQSMP